MVKKPKRKMPTDVNQLAHMIAQRSTAEPTPISTAKKKKNHAAVALGRLGGLKGGKARKEKLTPERRREIAQSAARKRWAKEKQD